MKKPLHHAEWILFTLVLMMAACTKADYPNAPNETTEITILQSPTEIKSIELHPDTTPASPCQYPPHTDQRDKTTNTHYHLDVSLNYDHQELALLQIIDYTNNTGETLTELPLVVPPASFEGAFQLSLLQINLSTYETSITMDGAVMRLRLDPALEPGHKMSITLNYQLRPPKSAAAFGYTKRQLLLANWYPFIPPYQQNQGWVINPPGAVGEHLAYPLTDITVNLHIMSKHKDLVIAASAPMQSVSEGCYQFSTESVRNYSLAISPYYQVTTLNNPLARINIYTFPEHSHLGERAANLALQAWETFTELYGDNQRAFMSVVEAEIADGLECDGLFFLSDWYFETADETPKNYFELLIVHETVHQWFYAFVHNNQATEPWLDEALATYSELIFYERHHPELSEWWWGYRIWYYDLAGSVNASIYDFNNYRPYINAVYLRGAAFLHTLRTEIGDPLFFDFLLTYTQSGEQDFLRDANFFFDLLGQMTAINPYVIQSGFFD